MKRLSKILMLVLVLTLSCALFGTLASAEDAAASESTGLVPPAEHSDALFSVTKGGTATYYTTADDFTYANIKGGVTVLYGNVTMPGTITVDLKYNSDGAAYIAIDLNGWSLSYSGTMFNLPKQDKPRTGVVTISNSNTEKSGGLYATMLYNGQHRNLVSLGYKCLGTMKQLGMSLTKDAGRITAVLGSTGPNGAYGNAQQYYNVDFVNTTACTTDTSTFLGYHNGGCDILVEDCDFYFVARTNLFRTNNGRGSVTFRGCDFYFYAGGDFFTKDDSANYSDAVARSVFKFEGCNIYGEHGFVFGSRSTENFWDYSFDAASRFSTMPPSGINLIISDEGYVPMRTYEEVKANFTYAPSLGATPVQLNETFAVNYVVDQASNYDFMIENGDADIYCKASAFRTDIIGSKKVVLNKDVEFASAVSNVTVDLNGHALVAKSGLTTGGTSVFYNSSENTASVYVSNGNTLNARYDNVYFGYSAAGVKYEGGRIFVAAYQLGAGQQVSSYYYNCDLVNVNAAWTRPSDGNSGRGSWNGGYNMGGSMNFDSCNLYMPIQTRIVHGNAGNFKLNFKDSNIYAAAGGQFTGYNDNAGKGGPVACTFDNSTVWGAFTWNGYDNASFPWTFTNGSKFYTALGSTQYTLPDGSIVAGSVETKTVTYTYAPTYGAEPVEFSHTLSTNYVVETMGDDYAFYNPTNGTYYKDGTFLPAIINGQTIVLQSNVTTDQTFSNLKIDLNGYNLTSEGTLLFTGGTTNFVYNNNADVASRVYAKNFMSADANNILYFGYSDASTKANGRITLTVDGVIVDGKGNHNVHLFKVDLVQTTAHDWSKSASALMKHIMRSLTVDIEECNFYAVASLALIGGPNCGKPAGGDKSFTITVKSSNFYGNAALVGRADNTLASGSTVTSKKAIDLDDVHFFGGARVFGRDAAYSGSFIPFYYADFDENCTFDFVHEDYVTPDGKQIVPTHLSETVNFVYGDGENDKFTGTFTSRYKYGTEADVKAIFRTFYRNINIDVNINFNLYVPVEYTYALDGLKGATHTGTIVIGGKTYNVLTVKQAPKDAHTPVGVTLYGGYVTYSADVVGYTKSLLKLADTTEYNKDSKMMAKYILYYIKAAAVAAQVEADFTAIDTLLDGFTLSEEDKALAENVGNTANLGTALARAYLDLSSNVGIVLQVKDGFVGTIKVTMAGMEPITKTYTADAPAGAEEYIIIGDIPVYDFRNTITVEVDGAVVGTYNLATYVNNKKTDVAYATYAYSKAAYDYQIKHGNPSTAD